MPRRLPLILGISAAIAVLALVGPVAVALMRSPGADGPDLAAQLFIGFLVLAAAAVAGLFVWGLARFLIRLLRRGG